MNKTVQTAIDELLYGDQGKYGYLFPYRERTPRVTTHPFTDLKKSSMKADQYIVSKMLDLDLIGWTAKVVLNLDLFPIQIAILQTMWTHPFPMLVASRGGSKSFILAVYAVLRALLDPGVKVIIVGAGLRQAKIVFNYIDQIWSSASVFRSIVGGGKKAGPRQNVDLCYFKIGQSIIYALPLGDGTKIRGFRANVVIADEFASIPEDVFDIVVRGFTATTKTPVDEAKRLAFEKTVATLDIPDDIKLALKKEPADGNQIIHSGTAYYEFNHFAKKHRMWCDLIESKGHGGKVADIFGGPNLIPDNFDYRDYVVIQLPHTHLPEGLLDPKQLAHSKAILPRNIFLMEYGCIFIRDSDGFYSRSLIESCTVMPNNPIDTPDGPVTFTPLMRGIKDRTYVMGIDPAAERDKFAIVILEVWDNHYRVVHCWSVNKPEFNKRKKHGLVTDDDYYAYCCSKIRSMVKLFNPIRIEMDSQGGGYAISEMLRNKKLLNVEEKDFPIYEVIDQDDPKETDGETDGRHILSLVQQDNTFNADANVALHKSLETKRLLFPAFDVVKIESSILAEKAMNVIFDTFEECVNNIEELKNELCTIQMSATSTGKEKFDTPNVVSAGAVEGRQRKGRLKKDRFIALMLSHKFLYDTDTKPNELIDYEDVAGNFKQVKSNPEEGMYRGPGAASMRNASDWKGETGQFGAVKRGDRH